MNPAGPSQGAPFQITALPDSPMVRLPRLAEADSAVVDRMDLAATLACFTPDARFTIATYDTVYQGRDTCAACSSA